MAARRPLLRRQLLRWLLTPLFLLLTADTFISYWVATSFSQRAYDRSLVDIAREVSLHLRSGDGRLELDMSEEARRLLFTDPIDRIYFEVTALDGRVVAGRPIAPPGHAAPRAPERFYNGVVDGAPVRIVELTVKPDDASRRPAAVVRVAETEAQRTGLAREILLSVVMPQVLLILIAGVVVWVGVVHGLSPLDRLQRGIASRSHLDRSPVAVDGVPGEVGPLLDSINELLARLDSVLTFQNRFITDAAHQLKTPIAALKAQFELAVREDDPDRLREAVRNVHAGLERLSRLASQLLSLARNEPDAVSSIAWTPLDLNEVALEVATGWVPEALKKGIDLGFEGSPDPATIRGDPLRLRELLDNLLDNAVRYSREGGHITVRVGAAPLPSVAVNDDGPSIPPHERARVFERFHRLLGSSHEGSGLGLAIAQEIARIHGAEIALRDDTDGIGNTFTVSFPPAVDERGPHL